MCSSNHHLSPRVCTLCATLWRLIHIASIRADTSSGSNNPSGYRWYTVAANNTNEEEDDIIPWIPYRTDGQGDRV
ncbi:hypothetical protein [Porphyromonas gingivalis]|uniref:hypothetical protein n=1 Tax=Porphyromonas gingivalis TaxID=837 RepID=UPI001E37CC27|nr:hypothetical protein [Porphyromonas gingivalis]